MRATTRTQAPLSAERVPVLAADRAAEDPVLTVPGLAVHVSTTRAFTAAALSAYHLGDDGLAALLVSELVTNSLQHSASGRPGGTVTVTVTVTAGDDRVLFQVADDSGERRPALRGTSSAEAEDGRGLHLVNELSADWGHYRRDGRRVTWFELKAEAVLPP